MGRYVDRQRCYVCSSRCLLPLPPVSSSSSSSSFSSSTHGVNAFLTVLLLAVVVIVATNFRHRHCGTGSPSLATGEPLAVAAGTHATGGRWRSAAVLSNSQSVVSLVCVCACRAICTCIHNQQRHNQYTTPEPPCKRPA